MSSSVLVGVVLAVFGIIIFMLRKEISAEKEMATSRETQKVALDKLKVLERASLVQEKLTREKETQEIQNAREKETVNRSPVGFYPRRVPPGNKNNPN